MRAWVQEQQSGPITLQENYPIPSTEPTEIKIKVTAVAINPVDFKLIDLGLWNQTWPRVAFGCDVAGVVVEVGDEVEGFAVGDEVYGCTDLFNVKSATFAEYAVTRPDGIYQKPSNVPFATAAGFGVSILTSYLAFYQQGLSLSGPVSDSYEDKTVFVWGGGSSVGFYAIQILTLLGYDVLTSASREFEKLISLGAKQVFNYKDEDVVEQIRKATGGKLKYIYDTASDSSKSGLIGRTDGPVSISTIAAYGDLTFPENVTHHNISLGGAFSVPELRQALPGFLESTNKLTESGSLEYLQELRFSTIDSIDEALNTLREGVTISKVLVTF